MPGLAPQFGQLGHGALHAVSQLILGDTRQNLRIACLGVAVLVELAQVVEHPPSQLRRAAGRVGQVEHRLLAATELHALILGRQEAAAPEPVIQGLVGRVARTARHQDDKGRQILVRAAEPVGHPGPHARPAGKL